LTHESERSGAIGGWLSEEEGKAFKAYARSIGISHAALATIIWTRELHQGRLGDRSTAHSTGTGGKAERVTARPSRPGFRDDFATHASTFGLTLDAAASLAIRDELQTRWLGTQLGIEGNHLDS
jgi:hypothetical protein